MTESVLGVLGNGFIGFVNYTDCFKNKKFSMVGIVLTGLVISRIFLMWIITLGVYTKILFPYMLISGNLIECSSHIWVIFNCLSVWFATSLNILYFLKTASFSHYIFLWLKRRIDKAFCLFDGVFITWLISFPIAVKVIKDVNLRLHHRHTSWKIHLEKSEVLFNYVLDNMGVSSLFMMVLVACFLLIIFLWRHNRWMQLNISGFRDVNKEVHVKAMKVLISFINLLYFICVFIETLCLFITENKLLFNLGFTTASMYPCSHSLMLILTKSQQKQASVRVQQQLTC
uniref:Taste receptor type 2 n=1 Tax=Nannospalax galili TaxID=1026970 RepID=A0A7S6B5Z9_NANGA|nr:taste receptor type 2 member 588 [Nannospalax galili]QKE46639.1 taste receptor type 2 member 588 [Nannospalax galili]